MLSIVQAPHPVLSQKAKRINKIDKSLLDLIAEMAVTLKHTTDPEGVGLAAPQVAQSLQLFIIRESDTAPLRVFINPEITALSEKKYPISTGKKDKGVKLEGCLSLKDIWGVVHRAASVDLLYQDEKGIQKKETFTGFIATIIQHECDHLNGTLFPKRVLEQKEKLYKAITNEEGETVFEEMPI
jgi:peptide deformylase